MVIVELLEPRQLLSTSAILAADRQAIRADRARIHFDRVQIRVTPVLERIRAIADQSKLHTMIETDLATLRADRRSDPNAVPTDLMNLQTDEGMLRDQIEVERMAALTSRANLLATLASDRQTLLVDQRTYRQDLRHHRNRTDGADHVAKYLERVMIPPRWTGCRGTAGFRSGSTR